MEIHHDHLVPRVRLRVRRGESRLRTLLRCHQSRDLYPHQEKSLSFLSVYLCACGAQGKEGGACGAGNCPLHMPLPLSVKDSPVRETKYPICPHQKNKLRKFTNSF